MDEADDSTVSEVSVMSAQVRIRGRVENTMLGKGVEVTVTRTETIDRLIDGGWVEVIEHDDAHRD